MKNKIVLAILILLAGLSLRAQQQQSYDAMSTRFYKPAPDVNDTAAFRAIGQQRAQSLFERSSIHAQNMSNRANQVYIENSIPDLFYVPDGDSLDVDELMHQIQLAVVAGDGPVQLRCTEKAGFLGVVETTNTTPAFQFNLVLKKVLKPFGEAKEEVWDVFLSEPVIR